MIYFISDTHFGHKNVIKYNKRPFNSVEEMDKSLIENWNKTVKNDDTVYILGDFCYQNEKQASYYLKQLNGKKHLIIGNHDTYLVANEENHKYFESIDKIKVISVDNKFAVLCHYPMLEWRGYNDGYYHIYGHLHTRTPRAYEYLINEPKALHTGVDITGFMPVTFENLLKINNKI